MARYDKYDPVNSGFRAPLAANLTLTAGSSNGVNGPAGIGPVGVSLDANGRVVVGAGQSGIVGVLVKNMPMGAIAGSAQLAGITAAPMGAMAGDIVDVMTHGEITDVAGLAAGTKYYADATTGALTTTSSGNKAIGYTVEATRLVVRCGA